MKNIWAFEDRNSLYAMFFPKGGIGAELGVYNGENADNLLKYIQPKTLYLVDPFKQIDGDKLHQNLRNKFAGHENVIIEREWDWDWLPQFNNFFDWIYLDTLHYYEYTSKEIPLILNALKPDGIFAGHDFCVHDLFGSGVLRPVIECVQEGYIKIEAITHDTPFVSFAARVLK